MRELLVIAALAMPWLNPLTLGPNSAAIQAFSTVLVAAGLLVYAAPHDWFQRRHFVAWVAAAWLSAAVISALMGLLQYAGVSALFSPWVSATAAGEAYGNLRQRNQFASLLNLGFAALLWWQCVGVSVLARDAKWVRWSRWNVVLVYALSGLLVIACAASGSRTGFLQTVLLALGSLGLGTPKRTGPGFVRPVVAPARLALWTVAGLCFSMWLLPHLLPDGWAQQAAWARMLAEGGSCNSRWVLWSNVVDLIAEKPWAGWGIDGLAYAHFDHLYAGPRFCEILDNAHNLPLHVAVTLGLPVAVLMCAAVLYIVLRLRPWRETDAARQLGWRVLFVIGLHSLLEYPLWYAPFQLALVLAVLLLLPEDGRARLLRSAGAQLLAGAGFVVCLYTGWDYVKVSQIYLAQSQRLPAYQDGTLEKIQGTWLFQGTAQFAELSVTPLTSENAREMLDLSLRMLHFSPEPMVLDRVLESARAVGRNDLVAYYQVRYRAAYPAAYAAAYP